MRVAMGVEYDGSSFHGWQLQDNVDSVQGGLEQAISNVADHPVRVHCAGRTDAGVHGEAQVVQVTIATGLPPERLREAVNFHTRPHPVSVIGAFVAMLLSELVKQGIGSYIGSFGTYQKVYGPLAFVPIFLAWTGGCFLGEEFMTNTAG